MGVTDGLPSTNLLLSGSLIGGLGSFATANLGLSEVGQGEIGSAVIGTANLVNSSVATDKIASGAVVTANIGASAVTATELASNAVTSAKISASNVLTAAIGSSNITTELIASGAVVTANLGALAVTTATIAAGAVTANKQAIIGTGSPVAHSGRVLHGGPTDVSTLGSVGVVFGDLFLAAPSVLAVPGSAVNVTTGSFMIAGTTSTTAYWTAIGSF